MLRSWPLIVGLLIVVASGVTHGVCSGRWTTAETMQAAVERLPRLPHVIGDWEGKDLDDDTLGKFREDIPGALQRRYVRKGTNQEVLIMLVCGKAGPVAVHTPEVCYQGNGWKMAAERTQQTVPLGAAEPAPLWKASFVKDGLGIREELRICWAWNAGGVWHAAAEPRMAFARYPVLHKLYVIYRVPAGDRSGNDPSPAFLRELLPAINQSVLGAS